MKNLKIAIVMSLTGLAACGSYNDAKTAKAGVIFRVTEITADTALTNTFCYVNDKPFFQATNAKASVENKPAPSNPKGTDLTIYQYSVDYFPLDGGPGISSLVNVPEWIVVPASGKADLSVLAFSEEAKKGYMKATTGTTNYTKVHSYQLHYTFDANTEKGDPVQAVGDLTMRIGNDVQEDCKQ